MGRATRQGVMPQPQVPPAVLTQPMAILDLPQAQETLLLMMLKHSQYCTWRGLGLTQTCRAVPS